MCPEIFVLDSRVDSEPQPDVQNRMIEYQVCIFEARAMNPVSSAGSRTDIVVELLDSQLLPEQLSSWTRF